MRRIVIYTIGHSNHTMEAFLRLLELPEIKVLVDIRRFPASRTFPQFDRERLKESLANTGIEYHWFESLGGRRPKQREQPSPNTGLRNESFRNFADYMQTAAFRGAIDTLLKLATAKRTAIMCAESVFWRCHRRLVSDCLVAQGHDVQHIFPNGDVKPHALTDGAHCASGTVTYPGPKMLFD